MSEGKGVEILIGGVILSVLGWSLVQQYDMNGTLQSVDTKVTNTEQRVDRIAKALPGIGVEVAAEEVAWPLQSVIVATKPFEGADGQWAMNFSLIDSIHDKAISYTCLLEGKDDYKPIWSIMGMSHDVEPHVRSARELTIWSVMMKQSYGMPAYINDSATLCFRETSASILKNKLVWLGPGAESDFADAPGSWKDLVGAVKENPELFRPKQ